jgi:NADH-quinone oxidoreductase subunit I
MGANMLAAPHPMVPGTTDGSYYRGEVTGPVKEQVEWVREQRPEDPTLPENRAKEPVDDTDRTRPRRGTVGGVRPDGGAEAARIQTSFRGTGGGI